MGGWVEGVPIIINKSICISERGIFMRPPHHTYVHVCVICDYGERSLKFIGGAVTLIKVQRQ